MRPSVLRSVTRVLLAVVPLVGLGAVELVPGLVGEYFSINDPSTFPTIPAERKPAFVRVDARVAFDEVTDGPFHGSKLTSNFYVRWTGVLKVATAGSHGFALNSDDGSRLTIDGKVVVDNGGTHAMTNKAGQVELTAGEHQILIEFVQGGGGAGIIASWTPPGGRESVLSAGSLFHAKGAENVSWDKAAWGKLPGDAPTTMASDYGPFVTHTIEAAFPQPQNYAYKGVVVKLAKDGVANLCFDTELLRVSCAWDGGYLKLPRSRDGLEGHPTVAGTPAFGSKRGPGWAKGGSFADPRTKGQGPLPADWAKWKGLHLDGTRVVLSYSVGKAAVLEAPAYQEAGAVFKRALTIGATSEALTMLVCEEDGAAVAVAGASANVGSEASFTAVALIGAPEGVALTEAPGGRLHLTLAPSAKPRSFTLALARGAKAAATAAVAGVTDKPVDLAALPCLTAGGAPRWGQPLVSALTLGSGDGPYVVDTVTVPLENPWKSYMRLTGHDFFADGRMAVSTIDGDVWIVAGTGTGQTPTWQRYATGLFQALGLKIVDGLVHVIGRDQLTVLHDLNKDGEADFYQNLNNDCIVTENYHEFALDLQTDKAGNFYFAKGSPWPPNVTSPHQGTMMKVSKDGSKLEIIATGIRAPNGLGMGPNDELTFSDNQGHWIPACKISLVNLNKPGAFFGMTPAAHRTPAPTTFEQPLCWLPMSMDNSSGGEGWVTGDKWGPFAGQMLHTAYGKGTFFIVMHEIVGGIPQGGVVKLPLTFQSGVMRIRQSPTDGQIWVSGMRGWQTDGSRAGALHRVRWTGKPANLPKRFHVVKDALEIGFSDPLDPATANNAENYALERWNYRWTGNYGSAEVNPSTNKDGHEKIDLTSAKLSSDGRTVTLSIPGLKPVNQIKIKYKLQGADGSPAVNEIYATVNVVP